jgi:hypothetical protein
MNNNNNKFNVTVNEESLESQHQNVHFSDQTPQWDYTVDSMPDPTFNIADTDDASLGNFFSRPVKIQSYSWATGTNLFETFNPWQDFFENTRVLNRITNFNLLRCKLKVRIVLNGNGFHYGRAIASYVPLHNLDTFTKDRSFFIQDVVAASQRPHVYLDPTTSQGGTLTLPFCWYENALRIPNQEWRDMGDIIIHGMQNLKHANGATDQVIVSVFAWAEDVSLSIPTANEPGALSPQMGEVFTPQVKDEYGTGPISRPAGIVAKAAGALSKIPGIGMYARATAMAANAVSGIASMFGYSRPVELADITPYKPTLLGNMVNTNVPDTSQKLTLDVKQELTVDPRVMGLGSTDEMTIKSIAQRESFLTQFGWAVSDPAETLLWNTEVSPVLWNVLSGTNDEIHMPACCFAALPFRRWRGTMKFRFQIVASAFHKGRMKITFDPSYPLTNEYNTNYTYIIDLAKERDFTVDIGWGHEKSLINHRNPIQNAIPYSTSALGADPGNNANGILSVYVVNDLTVPNSTANNDIEVNVFVSAGDDFEVFDPDSRNIEDLVWFEPQMGEVFTPQMAETGGQPMNQPDADLTKREDEPMKEEPSITMAPTLTDQDHTICVYYGDPVTSFRQCLKRYNYHSAVSSAGDISTSTLINLRNSNFPYYRGYAPGAVHETIIPAAATPYNYCKMTLLNYITPAFTCRRGGLRWKYFRTGGNTEETSLMMVSRDASSTGGYAQQETAMITQGSGNQFDRVRQNEVLLPHTWDGAVVTSTRHNPVIEAEIPYYSNSRFSPAKQADWTTDSGLFRQFHWMSTIWEASAADAAAIHCFVSVGEDYTLGFFTGAPVAWRVPQESEPASS